MKKLVLLLVLLSIAAISGAVHAQGLRRLTIAPTRIVIEPRERSGELSIMNIYAQAATYRVKIVNNKMKEEGGGYNTLSGPLDPAFDPEEYIRLTPRQFRLEPNGVQRIRFSVRRPPDLPPGDYRFHIMATRLFGNTSTEQVDKGVKATVATNIGISIPVVVRQGDYNGDVKIEDVQLYPASPTQKLPKATLTIRRIGNNDIFGGIDLYWVPAGSDQRELIGTVRNSNLFHEIERLKTSINLNKYPQGSGKLIAQYIEDYYKQGVIDELVIDR